MSTLDNNIDEKETFNGEDVAAIVCSDCNEQTTEVETSVATVVESVTSTSKEFIPYDVVVKAHELNVREDADKQSSVLDILKIGDIVNIVDEKNNFGKLADAAGWIMLEFTGR